MSYIKNPNQYRGLPSVCLVEPAKNFRITHLGFYDPIYGIDTEPTYQSGKLEKYDDSHLEGKNCALLYFRHRFFGINPYLKKLSKGHWHTKCFVPINDMNIWDCSHRNAKGDVFFFANLCPDMPISLNNDSYKLFVIEPMLTPSELENLALKTENVFQWKAKLDKGSKDVARAHGNEVIAISMMTEAVVAKSIYADHIVNLRKLLGVAQDKLLQLTGDKYNVILDAIDKVEMEFDVGVLGNEEISTRISSLLRKQSIEIKTLDAITNMDMDTNESMKRHMFDTALRFIGIDKMKEYLNIVEGNGNPAGLLTPTLATLKSLDRINLQNLDANERKQIIQRAMNYIKSPDFMNVIKQQDLDEEDVIDTINSGIESKMIELAEGKANLVGSERHG